MNNKLADLISNYLNEQKQLTDKYTRLFNQIKQADSYYGRNSNSILNLKKRSSNSDYSYSSNKDKVCCQFCGKQYTSRLPLKNHIEKFHFQEPYTSKQDLSTKQLTPYDDDDDCRNDDNSYNEADEELRQKLLRNVQAIEKREHRGPPQEEVIISGIDSDSEN
ncbi:unnamed protein product (macronuclear) [Paramecium tetraurelia]|uniref:C2H2-type domain-containing protein n=1 Tax=Paramecium tetraurelia TaxID=5888 RepID=A0E1K6_PARTE|nr:uncharacterized protein GSPATT00022343001 [Paramecium tetraurelia]CAK89173.1 unnamed protein product [Paramecium tetraurelia]|eukprot:XP_001456570.1 hypothetical protein (macronuclear) [Paramecium tetraurelia strain d4-2]